MNIVDESRLEGALTFLGETDDAYAQAKATLLRREILCKRVRAKVLLTGTPVVEPDGRKASVEMRKAAAETHSEVIAADEDYVEATLEFERLKAKRARAEIVIEVFRTLEASRRKL